MKIKWNIQNILFVVCLFSWRHNPLWSYFHSPVAGFSLLVFEVSWSHKMTRHSRYDFSGRVINPSQKPLPDNTQQTNIHAPGGIRTHNLGRRAAEDLCLRRRGRWDRHAKYTGWVKCRECDGGLNQIIWDKDRLIRLSKAFFSFRNSRNPTNNSFWVYWKTVFCNY